MVLRPARHADANALAELFIEARRVAMPWLPDLHTEEETHGFVTSVVAGGGTWVAEVDGVPAGFLTLEDGRVDHLYVEPHRQRQGIGSVLLRHAQGLRPEGLELYVFQRNRVALAFYARHGFDIVETTDGAGNEEREPDARLRWGGDRPTPSPR
jgi:ribosomal protein S18 acetylase RimI-like enzyme